MTAPDDLVQPFQVESMAAQGRLVRLGRAIDAILSAHSYPAPVAHLLGELMVVGAMLSGTLKRKGVLTIQAHGDDAIRLLVADLTHDGKIRGYARFDEAAVAELTSGDDSMESLPVPRLLGGGRLVFTLDHGGSQRPYQGIVPLEGGTLAECAQAYFRQSVQSEAAFKIAVGRGEDGWRAGGLMLQRLARKGYQLQSGDADIVDVDEAWRRAVVLMGSCTNDELLSGGLHPHDLLYRLFNEDGVRVFRTEALRMECRCSRGRVQEVLGNFPKSEIAQMKIGDDVVVNCEFCNREYRFTPADIDHIFA